MGSVAFNQMLTTSGSSNGQQQQNVVIQQGTSNGYSPFRHGAGSVQVEGMQIGGQTGGSYNWGDPYTQRGGGGMGVVPGDTMGSSNGWREGCWTIHPCVCLKIMLLCWLDNFYYFKLIFGHENSEPRETQLRTQHFSGGHDVAVLWITDGKWYWVLSDVLCLSQLVDTRWLRSDVVFVSEIYLK